MSNSLDPDEDRHFVWSDLGPNCLQNYQQTTLGDKELSYHTLQRANDADQTVQMCWWVCVIVGCMQQNQFFLGLGPDNRIYCLLVKIELIILTVKPV